MNSNCCVHKEFETVDMCIMVCCILLFQFPDCMDEDAISVACLDLHYSVTFR